jgi:hypothetical protein
MHMMLSTVSPADIGLDDIITWIKWDILQGTSLQYQPSQYIVNQSNISKVFWSMVYLNMQISYTDTVQFQFCQANRPE